MGASGMYGADVPALRELAQALSRAAERLTTVRDVVGPAVDSAEWWGPSGEQFRAEWNERHLPALVAAASDLDGAAGTVRENADDQERTSGVLDGGGAGGAPAPFVPVSHTVPTQGGDGADGSDDGDRRDQGRDARDERNGRGDDEPSTPDGEHAIPGPAPYPTGLGDPVPGEDAPAVAPPAWTPPDEGAGAHGTEDDGFWDRRKEDLVEGAAHATSGMWPDASRNLLHYLDNSGADLEQPVDTMLSDLPQLEQEVSDREHRLGVDAIARAQAAGADGPVTFPVNTDWNGYYAGPEQSDNWYYATGGFQYNLNGQVTVHPPDSPGGQWRYESETAVNYRDRYNWDGGKQTQIGPLTVTDAELQELHRKGLAQEFNMVGTSSTRTAEGTA